MSRILICALLVLMPTPLLARHAAAQPRAPSASEAARDTSAQAGPLAVGAAVLDPAGQTLGRITRLTTARDGRTLVMVRKGVDSFAIPADRLRMTPGGAVSSLDREGIKALGDSATR